MSPNPHFFYVYILQSLKDNSLYIGYSTNVQKRLIEHNSGKSRYTNQHKPYILVGYIAFTKKQDAQRYEKYLKSGWGRRTIKSMFGSIYINEK
jgi:putative endonuclease